MGSRSKYILGDDFFLKIVTMTNEQGKRLEKSLTTNKELPPFTSNEFMFNYFVNKFKNTKILENDDINIKNNSLLSPKNIVMLSSKNYNVKYLDKYLDSNYENVLKDLKNDFNKVEYYLKNIKLITNDNKYVRTILILSERVDGDFNTFIKQTHNKSLYNKQMLDGLIHIMYLHHVLQNKYQAVHGDPKLHNYTWLKLDNPVNIVYDFRTKYDRSDSMIIKRQNVKNLFFMTDLEFVYSSVLKTENISDEIIYFNFQTEAAWYGKENDKDRIFVPKISKNHPYNLNYNIYGGYFLKTKESDKVSRSVYDYYGVNFPRLFTIDIMSFIKMILTFWYADTLNGEILRKLHIYFTKFCSLSEPEKNPKIRDNVNYKSVSPGDMAVILNSK